MSFKIQSPYVYSPNSYNEQWISDISFDLTENTYFDFHIDSDNEIDKEVLFIIYFREGETKDFGSSILGGAYEIPIKGEIGKTLEEKQNIAVNGESCDFLLEHCYPDSVEELKENITNKTHNDLMIVFSSKKEILGEIKDNYGNSYIKYPNVVDNSTKQVVTGMSGYSHPVMLKYNDTTIICESEVDILKFVGSIKLAITKNGEHLKIGSIAEGNNEQVIFDADLPISLVNNDSKLCFALKSPVISYDVEKMADFAVTKVVALGKQKA